MRFIDIPKLTPEGRWRIDVRLGDIGRKLAEFEFQGRLDLDPDFGRGPIWTEHQSLRYIEHLLAGGKGVRDIRFNARGWTNSGPPGDMVLVDGRQRIEAVRRFMAGDLPVFGCGLHGFERDDRRRIARSTTLALRLHINDLPTRAAVLRWHLELNTGRTVHHVEHERRVQDLLLQERSRRRPRDYPEDEENQKSA